MYINSFIHLDLSSELIESMYLVCFFFMSTATNAQCFWKQTGIRKRLISWIVSTYNTMHEFYLTTFIKYLVFLKVLHELLDFPKLKIKKCAIRYHKYFMSLLWPAYKGFNKNDSNLNKKKIISLNFCYILCREKFKYYL